MRGQSPAWRAGIAAWIRRRQAAAFFLTTLSLSWGWWAVAAVLAGGGGISRGLLIPGGFGPPIAAVLVMRASGYNVRSWLARGLRWHVAPWWYLIAIGLPIVLVLGGVGLALAVAGGPITPAVVLDRLPLFALSLALAAVLGGGQEEFGWRGFALPRLQEAYGALTASLTVGIVWAVWHVPLFLLGAPRNQTGNVLLYGVLVVALSVLLTWCYNSTGGSILLAMLLHGAVNASGNLLPAPMAALEQWPVAIDVGMVGSVCVAALLVVVWTDTATLSRHGRPDRFSKFAPGDRQDSVASTLRSIGRDRSKR